MSGQDSETLSRALESKAINQMPIELRGLLIQFLTISGHDGMESVGPVPEKYQEAVNEYYRLHARFIIPGEGSRMPHFDTSFMKIT